MTVSLSRSYKSVNERRFARLKATYLMKYWHMNEDGPDAIETANTKDVSAGGVRFYTRQKLRKGAVIRVQILIPPIYAKVSAFAQVIGVSSAWPRKMYYVSAAFIEISREDYELLDGFISGLLSTREAGFLFDEADAAVRTPSPEDVHE